MLYSLSKTIFPLLLAASCVAAPSEQILEPASIAEVAAYDCRDAALWNNAPGYPAVKITGGDVLHFAWDGNADWRNFRPLFGRVDGTQALPLIPGPEGKVRVKIQLGIDQLEYDADISPALIFDDAAGKELTRWEIYPPDYLYFTNQLTAPDAYRQIDRSFVPPEGAKSLRLGFDFRGNASSARVGAITLEPAPAKPFQWDVARRQERSFIPDIQYAVTDAKPRRDEVKLAPEEVDRLLARRPLAVPKLEKHGDRVVFSINGQEEAFAIHMTPFTGLRGSYLQDMDDIGFKMHTITVKTGPCGDTPNSPSNIWLGENQYDFTPIATAIRELLSKVPDAYVVLHLSINVYHAWGKEHPEDVHVDKEGRKAVANWSRVIRYGDPEPTGNEFYEASNHSEQFREDGARMLEALGRWLNEAPEGKVVVGAYLNGSADGQWLFSYEPEFAEYSQGTLRAFRHWLRGKYADEAALSAAWGFPTTFDTAAFPDWEARRRQFGPDPNVARSPLMEYNGAKAQAADYNEFLSVSNTRRHLAFGHALKKGSDGRLLTGGYWPTLPAAYPLSHTNFIEILNSPDIDFISRGGLLGAALHGKMTAGEFDLRNTQSGLEAWLDYDHPFHAKSQADFRRQVLAGYCREFATGGGFHLWDMWGGWFWDPGTREILTEALQMRDALHDVAPLGENYVGVFVDDQAANQLAQLGRSWLIAAVQKTAQSMGWGWGSAWEFTGLPVRFFVQEDALHPQLAVPRVAIFLNPLTMTLEQAARIRERFETDGRVVVYMTAPGLAAPGTPDNPERITGFKIAENPATINKALLLEPPDTDPLLANIHPGSMLGLWTPDMNMDWYTNPAAAADSPGKILARYAGSGLAGMLVDRNAKRTKVWIGAPGAISPELIRNMAREAGLEPMCDNGSAVIFGAGLLGVIATPAGGAQQVTLPDNFRVERCLTGQEYEVDGRKLRFNLAPANTFGDIAIFAVRSEP